MSKIGKLIVVMIMVSSFAFSQQGQTLMNGGFSYTKAKDVDATMLLSLEYGGFVADSWLLSGAVMHQDTGADSDTMFELGVDWFITEKWHVGIRHNETWEDEALRIGMFMPFKESGNVYLHPHFVRWMDMEVNQVNVGLSLWF
ncbi:MAG: hypothetical protein ACJ0RN_02615 [Candidatus Neomarinimicrobiota bacterium]|tara:strand:- start:1443 stop:1871 length:429 start_codon:yes stop_codon:yes gene_type:complete